MPRGRPSKFNKIDLEAVRKLAIRGWTDDEMADFFGVARSTWSEWKEKQGEFRDALKDWKEEADARVVRSLYERATGYSHPEDKIFLYEGKPVTVETTKHYPPDTTAAIFWMKNRDRENWRDRHDHVHSMDDLTDADIDQRIRQAVAEGALEGLAGPEADEEAPEPSGDVSSIH